MAGIPFNLSTICKLKAYSLAKEDAVNLLKSTLLQRPLTKEGPEGSILNLAPQNAPKPPDPKLLQNPGGISTKTLQKSPQKP